MPKATYREKIGKRFGSLVVLSVGGSDKNGQRRLLCKCDCGNQKEIRSNCLGIGANTRSCGCRKLAKDRVGQRFNQWLILSRAGSSNRRGTLWTCKCDCGTIRVVDFDSLRRGTSKSCGCLQKSFEFRKSISKDLSGKRFGRLVAIKQVDLKGKSRGRWECMCDCGNVIVTSTSTLRQGEEPSCGCRQIEWAKSNSGPRHYLWNVELSAEERRRKRNDPQSNHWRESVLGVFGPACVICQSTDRPQAHHIESWKHHKDRRFDTDNGVVLCRKCHDEFHGVYHHKDAGLVELMQFMESKLIEPRYAMVA